MCMKPHSSSADHTESHAAPSIPAGCTSSVMLDSAVALAKRGKPVFPCKQDKSPLTEHGFKDATKDSGIIRQWWTQHPDALIGMPTGSVSGLVVLDVDNKNGHDGDESLYQLQLKYGQLPDTPQVLTPSGGRHVYFQHPGIPIKSTASGIGDGLDIRGEGGYVIVPPSRVNGKCYEYEASNPTHIADMPGWLIELTKKERQPTPAQSVSGGSVGNRNVHFASLAGSMRRRGMGQDAIMAALKVENQVLDVPLDIEEVEKIAASIAKYEPGSQEVVYSRAELAAMIEKTDSEDLDQFMEINRLIGGSDLSPIETAALHKAIKRKAGINITDLRLDIEACKDQADVDQQELTKIVMQTIGRDNLLFTDEWFYLWDQAGVWKQESDRMIKQTIHHVCNERNIPYTSHLVDAVTNLIKTESFHRNHQFNQDSGTINVRNGELHYDTQLGAWELRPHSREHYRTAQLTVSYDPEALAPRFKQFLAEVFAGDAEMEAKTMMALELIGYTLLTTCRYEKFVLMIGSGANGKSVLLGVLEALLGRENICAVQPSRFDNPFNRAHLHGKLANIITEIAEGAEIADAQLKAIVSGELTTAEHKMKTPFEFHPFATCWLGTNHMPHTRDFSDALFRRVMLLTFPNKFEGSNCDPYLKDKLTQELPGILNLALRAIAGVFIRNSFTSCPSTEEEKCRWKLEADQVAQFIDDECETCTGEFETVDHLYRQYQLWAKDAGIERSLSKNKFSNRIERLGYQRKRKAKGGRGFVGLRHRLQIEDSPGWDRVT